MRKVAEHVLAYCVAPVQKHDLLLPQSRRLLRMSKVGGPLEIGECTVISMIE